MAYLVRNDVRLGKITLRLEFAFKLTEKGKIEIELFVAGAIEWAGDGYRIAARRLRLVTKKHRLGRAVSYICLLRQNLRPNVLGTAHDRTRELFVCIARGRGRIAGRGLLLLNSAATALQLIEQLAHVAARAQVQHCRENYHADTSAAQSQTATYSTPVFNVRTRSQILPTHSVSPCCSK